MSAAGAAKNQLTAADARLLEVAFELRLSALLPSESSEPSIGSGSLCSRSLAGEETMGRDAASGDAGNDQPARVDKSTLAVPAPRRYRNKAHLRYVAQQQCLICGRKPSDPSCNRRPWVARRATSSRCRSAASIIRVGNEAAWWKDAGIDPAKAARKLWNDTRMDQGRIGPGPTAQRPAADRTTNPEQSWKMQLALDNHGIDDSGDVVDGRVVDELHYAGIEVDFYFGDVAASGMPSQ